MTGTQRDSQTRRMNWRASASLESTITRVAVASDSLAHASAGVLAPATEETFGSAAETSLHASSIDRV